MRISGHTPRGPPGSEAVASRSSTPSLLLTLVTFIVGLAVAATSAAQPVRSRAHERLRDRAVSEGRVRVIVGARTGRDPRADARLAPDAATREEHRRRIAAAQDRVSALVRRTGGETRARFESIPFSVAEVDAVTLDGLLASGDVESVQEDVLLAPHLAQSVERVNAPAAWADGLTGQGWTVAVIDTGVDANHPFLAGKVVAEGCYSASTSYSVSTCPGGVPASTAAGSGASCAYDGCEHGTHVAGIAVGAHGPGGLSGVARDASLIAINVFSYFPDKGGIAAFESDVIRGLERVYMLRGAHRIAAVNLSLGSGAFASACDDRGPAMAAAISAVRGAGIAVVASTGNEGQRGAVSFPACISSAVGVGATCDAGPDEGMCAAGLDGVASYSNVASITALVAPGSYITSSVPGGAFASYDGTSMAAPHVAGAWALIKQRYPSITVAEALGTLRDHAVMMDDARSGGTTSGLRRLDLGFLGRGPYTLSVTRSGGGSGTVTSSPGGIDCGAGCSATFPAGTRVTLTATPAAGSTFAGWKGHCGGNGPCTMDLTTSRSVTATFNAVDPVGSLGIALDAPELDWSGLWMPQAETWMFGGSAAASGRIRHNETSRLYTQVNGPGTLTFRWKASSEQDRDVLEFRVNQAMVQQISGETDWAEVSVPLAFGGSWLEWNYVKDGAGSAGADRGWLDHVEWVPDRNLYQVTVLKDGIGSGGVVSSPRSVDCGPRCSTTFAAGTRVTLWGYADPGSTFLGWRGPACTHWWNPCELAIDRHHEATAIFGAITQPVAVVRSGTGAGVVKSTPSGLDCGTTCSAGFAEGARVRLAASAASGSTFVGWAGACGGTGVCELEATQPREVRAVFEAGVPRRLISRESVTLDGTDDSAQYFFIDVPAGATRLAVRVAGGIGDADLRLRAGVPPTMTDYDCRPFSLDNEEACEVAEPSAGRWHVMLHAFRAFSGATLVASYETPEGVHVLDVATEGNGTGWVRSQPDGIDCGATCAAMFDAETTVTLTAAPTAGSVFIGWSGACTGTGSCVTTLEPSREVRADFRLDQQLLRILSSDGGTVASDPSGLDCGAACEAAFPLGATVTLTPRPGEGWSFAGWGGACTGTRVCTVTMVEARTVTAAFRPLSYSYLAEGATSSVFDTRLALLNPGAEDAVATLDFQRAGHPPVTLSIDVPARTRRTVWPARQAGLAIAEFSTHVTSTAPLIVDRTMTWAEGRAYGAHAESARPEPATTWYLAEGATHGAFNLFYLLQNPTSAAAEVTITFMDGEGRLAGRRYVLPPESRTTIWVDHEKIPGAGFDLAHADISATVRSDGVPIIVERAMYADVPGQFFGAGHESAGVTEPAARWFLAEGATGPYFDLFVLIANPSSSYAELEVTYLLPDGSTITRDYTVPGYSRHTIWVDHEDPALANTAVSIMVRCITGVKIVVERAMWWPDGAWHEAHNSPGATATGTVWAVAEGEVDEARGLETYLLVANTSAAAATVRVTLLFEDGTEAVREFGPADIPARSRFNVPVGHYFPEARGRRFGAIVESRGDSPAEIVVERATYWDAEGVRWAAGTNALATRLR